MQQYPPPVPFPNKAPAWMWLAPLLSCGMLSAVPALAIAIKLKTGGAWAWFAALASSSALGVILVGGTETDSAASDVGATLMLVSLVVSLTYGAVAGKKVPWTQFAPPPPPVGYVAPMMMPPAPMDPNSAAIASVQAARDKRAKALSIVASDPAMARELGIGRPDLRRNFDDGGLVDLNSAPEEVLVRVLGLDPAQAQQVLSARNHLGKFEHVDDLMNMAELAPRTFDQIRERIILL